MSGLSGSANSFPLSGRLKSQLQKLLSPVTDRTTERKKDKFDNQLPPSLRLELRPQNRQGYTIGVQEHESTNKTGKKHLFRKGAAVATTVVMPLYPTADVTYKR